MSSNEGRSIASRAWLGVAAITLGVGTALTPTVVHADPATPGNPSGSGTNGPSGSTSKPKSNSTTAEDNIDHPATTGKTECSKPEEECMKPGEMVGMGQDTVTPGLGNSTIVGGGGEYGPRPAPTVGMGQDTVTPGLGNSTIVGGTAATEPRPELGAAPTVGTGQDTAGGGQDTVPAGLGNSTIVGG